MNDASLYDFAQSGATANNVICMSWKQRVHVLSQSYRIWLPIRVPSIWHTRLDAILLPMLPKSQRILLYMSCGLVSMMWGSCSRKKTMTLLEDLWSMLSLLPLAMIWWVYGIEYRQKYSFRSTHTTATAVWCGCKIYRILRFDTTGSYPNVLW